jgi:putative thioredoxin
MSIADIINVTEANFEDEVLMYSDRVPVVVDFWAEWCKPCKALSPILEKMAKESKGAFRLAKVDVDENPNLPLRYNVRSIPTVKAFIQGEVVSEFTGLQTEDRLQDFISRLAPTPFDLILEKGASYLQMHQWKKAEDSYREVLDEKPDHTGGLLGLSKSLLGQGVSAEALEILQDFPPSREFARAEILLPLAQALSRLDQGQLSAETPLDAAYSNALRLVKRSNIPAALDGLLDILRQDKRYQDGAARQIFLALLELLGEDNPQTRQYRDELASTLF